MPDAIKIIEATPVCPRVDTEIKKAGRGKGMGGKATVETDCEQMLIWRHGEHGYGAWFCSKHGHIDEARPVQPVKGDQREGLSAA